MHRTFYFVKISKNDPIYVGTGSKNLGIFPKIYKSMVCYKLGTEIRKINRSLSFYFVINGRYVNFTRGSLALLGFLSINKYVLYSFHT